MQDWRRRVDAVAQRDTRSVAILARIGTALDNAAHERFHCQR